MNILTWSADVGNALFAVFCIIFIHRLFRSPRKIWQCILAWTVSFLFCLVFTQLFTRISFFSSLTYESASTLTGFFCVFSFIFLFPQLPVSQRVFVYFMIVNLMYTVVMVARVLAGLVTAFTHWNADVVFLLFHVALLLTVTHVFFKYYAKAVVKQLNAVRGLSLRYAMFAAFNFGTTLLILDAWMVQAPISPQEIAKVIGLCAVSFTSYYAIFSSLSSIRILTKTELYKKSANTDVLTGLGNRLAFETCLKEKATAMEPICCIFLDINELKKINDSHGHQYGDKILKDSAQFLRKIAGDDFRIFRIGGDEFTLISKSHDSAVSRLDSIHAQLEKLARSNGEMGFAWGTGFLRDYEHDSAEAMINRCDNAMYENKRRHKKPINFVAEDVQ